MIKQDFLIRMIQQIISAIAEVILYRKPIQRKEWEEYNGIARQILGFPVEMLKTMDIKDVLEQYKNDNEQMDKIELAAMLLLKISDETDSDSALKAKLAQEIIDRLEQEGNEIGTSLDDPNVDSSTVSDDGTITNTYEDNTTPGDKTVEDVIEEIANENHDGEVSDDIWNDLNDLYLEEIGENSEEIGGKSR